MVRRCLPPRPQVRELTASLTDASEARLECDRRAAVAEEKIRVLVLRYGLRLDDLTSEASFVSSPVRPSSAAHSSPSRPSSAFSISEKARQYESEAKQARVRALAAAVREVSCCCALCVTGCRLVNRCSWRVPLRVLPGG